VAATSLSCPSCLIVRKHPFHLVTPSPWPILTSLAAFFLVLSLVLSWSAFSPWYLLPTAVFILYVCIEWGRSISIEATYLGCHTNAVRVSHSIGFALFIISEVFFFVSWFWAYIHFSLSPAVELGSLWPPAGILVSSPFTVPLLNTCVLLTSGATVTWATSSLVHGLYFTTDAALLLTCLLGLFFLRIQGAEYFFSSFTISDSCFGRSFYILTGFHGLHVFVGTLLLLVSLLKLRAGTVTSTRHLYLTLSTWYWHFVDVIWLLLFVIVYIWGS